MYVAEWMADWPWPLQVLVRISVAAALGGLVGIEREHRGQSAGFRTQMLVGLGAALAMGVGMQFAHWPGALPDYVRIDLTRIAYGVMGGVGFLGAGAILNRGFGIRGLTTAASLWCTAAIGLAAGVGMLEVAAAATVLVVFILAVLRVLDRIVDRRWVRSFRVTLAAGGAGSMERVREALSGCGVELRETRYHRPPGADRVTVVVLGAGRKGSPEEVVPVLEALDGILGLEVTLPDAS